MIFIGRWGKPVKNMEKKGTDESTYKHSHVKPLRLIIRCFKGYNIEFYS